MMHVLHTFCFSCVFGVAILIGKCDWSISGANAVNASLISSFDKDRPSHEAANCTDDLNVLKKIK